MRTFQSLSEQEILALAISLEEEDARIYGDFAEGLKDTYPATANMLLQMLAEGHSIAEIAEMLSLSPKTVETYRARMMDKLGIDGLASLVRFAIQQGLTPLE